jgi:predicted transcriptional regulator
VTGHSRQVGPLAGRASHPSIGARRLVPSLGAISVGRLADHRAVRARRSGGCGSRRCRTRWRWVQGVVRQPLVTGGSCVGAPADGACQADAGAGHLTVAGLAPELADQFDHLAQRRRAQRFSLGQQSAGAVDGRDRRGAGIDVGLEQLALVAGAAQAQLVGQLGPGRRRPPRWASTASRASTGRTPSARPAPARP